MPRQPRLIVPDVALHIVQRGNDRQRCFSEDSDYYVYLLHLRKLAAQTECDIHAYCLMSNHVHLLLTPRNERGCIDLMRNLGQRYVQYFNKHHHRTGTLWEGRYRSCLVQSARYVLACYRYIELNRVRAGMASRPEAYCWSSHQGNCGQRFDRLITPHEEFLALGASVETRYSAYRGLFQEHTEPHIAEIRRATNGGYPLASDPFKTSLALPGERLAARPPGPQPRKGKGSSGSDPELGL